MAHGFFTSSGLHDTQKGRVMNCLFCGNELTTGDCDNSVCQSCGAKQGLEAAPALPPTITHKMELPPELTEAMKARAGDWTPTRRQWYAGQALQGLCSWKNGPPISAEVMANWSFELADAMIAHENA